MTTTMTTTTTTTRSGTGGAMGAGGIFLGACAYTRLRAIQEGAVLDVARG